MSSRRLTLLGSVGLALAACAPGEMTRSEDRSEPRSRDRSERRSDWRREDRSTAPSRDLETVLASDPQFGRFLDAARRTQVDEALSGRGVYTVFAPTDNGWGDIPVSLREDLYPANRPADSVRGRALVAAHVVEGRYPLSEFRGRRTRLETLNGNRIVIDGTDSNRMMVQSDGGGGYSAGGSLLFWGASNITRGDIEASNGIVHVVHKPIMP
jgi:uncharacterized surface protein with fasciclin (FAS1) repeats